MNARTVARYAAATSWKALTYYNLFRFLIAFLFVALYWIGQLPEPLGQYDPVTFAVASHIYLFLSVSAQMFMMYTFRIKNKHVRCIGLDLKISLPVMTGQRFKPKKIEEIVIMKHNVQSGFTLIELMIVVAIIGILAYVAIPRYQDYTARNQVSEAMTLTSGVKTPLAEWLSDKGGMPTDIESLTSLTAGKYVTSIVLGGTAAAPEIHATMASSGVNAGIQGSIFGWVSADRGNSWDCSAANGVTNLEDKYLPGSCK